jgi:hypothetical protein
VNAFRILTDSNLDCGQNRYHLREYRQANPDTIYDPPTPQPGRFIVDANVVAGVFPYGPSRWLGAFEPTGHLVYSYLLYDLSPEDLRNRACRIVETGAS